MCDHVVVTIIKPPDSTTTYRGSEVIVSCGYRSDITFPVAWVINGTSYVTGFTKTDLNRTFGNA